jgi:hypothetical protein
MAVYKNVLHALCAEPPSGRPGDLIRLRFEVPNLSGGAIGPGTVSFLLGDGLEPGGETVVPVSAAEPGSAVIAEVIARLAGGADDGAPIAVQAVLAIDGTTYASNVAQVAVLTSPILDGARSGTFVDEHGDGIVAVRAVVVNEGDGAARNVRLLLPAPAGCLRLDGDGDAEVVCERLEPGAELEVGFDARIVAPLGTIAADAAQVRSRDGVVRPLAARTTVTPRAALAIEPTLRPGRPRTSIALAVRNDGWADARDVAIAVVLPAALRPLHDGVSVDGVSVRARTPRRAFGRPPATLAFAGPRVALALDVVAARATVQIEIAAAHAAGCDGGVVRIESHDLLIESAFVPRVDRTVRLRVESAPPVAAPGERIAVRTAIVNAGDVVEHLTLAVAGGQGAGDPVALAVSPGRIARVLVEATVPRPADGSVVELELVASDDGDERARVVVPVTVRTSASPASGTALAPAASPPDPPSGPQLRLDVPGEVDAGCPFGVALIVDAPTAIDTLTIRATTPSGSRTVAGSTTIDAMTIREHGGRTPLEHGVVLRGVPSRSSITVRWSLLAEDGTGDVRVDVAAVADGVSVAAESGPIVVRPAPPFATRDPRLGYDLVSHTPAFPPPDKPSAPAPAPVEPARDTVRLTFSPAGDAPIVAARLLRGDAPAGLAGYLPVLGAFFPTGSSATGSAAALAAARTAIGDGFDRLHVLLRLPGFAPSGDDLENAPQRRSLLALYAALCEGIDDGSLTDDAFAVELDRSRLREIVSTFADARFGAPSALRAILALIPRRCDDEPLLSGALARYTGTLDDVLSRCERLNGDEAERVLAAGRDLALEDARASLVAALRAHTLPIAVR